MQYVGYIIPDHSFDPNTVKAICERFQTFANEIQILHAGCYVTKQTVTPYTKLTDSPIALPVYNPDLERYYDREMLRNVHDQFKAFADAMIQEYFSGAPESFRPDLVESGYLGHAMRCIEDARNVLIEACAYRHSGIDPMGGPFALQVGIELLKAQGAFIVAATRRKHQLSK